jgi:hypothetical protein
MVEVTHLRRLSERASSREKDRLVRCLPVQERIDKRPLLGSRFRDFLVCVGRATPGLRKSGERRVMGSIRRLTGSIFSASDICAILGIAANAARVLVV